MNQNVIDHDQGCLGCVHRSLLFCYYPETEPRYIGGGDTPAWCPKKSPKCPDCDELHATATVMPSHCYPQGGWACPNLNRKIGGRW